ncbi:DUF504 domain-containing protein [Candidatus Woesearchaeota archaeon]|nr:DUF504 domain-containing protein [Candidatus Woesearchaeota archaeon]
MTPIQDLLNKIKWDKRENTSDYTLFYFDRILNKMISVPYNNIKRLEGSFMVLNNEDETNIPLHRIKKVAKKDAIIWERK